MTDVMPKLTDDNFHENTFEPVEIEPAPSPEVPTPEVPVETSTKETPTKTNDDEVKKFQSIADVRLAETVKERTLREQAEAKAMELQKQLEALKNPPKPEETLTEPTEFVLPADYDEFEAISNANSIHAQNKKLYDKSVADRLAYQAKIIKLMQTETKQQQLQREKQEQDAAMKADMLGKLTAATGNEKEAEEIFNWLLSKQPQPEDFVKFYRADQNKPQTQTKETLAMPPNLGAISGGAERAKNADDAFGESIKPIRKSYI